MTFNNVLQDYNSAFVPLVYDRINPFAKVHIIYPCIIMEILGPTDKLGIRRVLSPILSYNPFNDFSKLGPFIRSQLFVRAGEKGPKFKSLLL